MTRLLRLLAVCALALPLMGSSQAGLTFTDIDFPGAHDSFANGINKVGQIVGAYRLINGGFEHGFLRDTSGTFTTIDVPGAQTTVPKGINKAGLIVGTYSDTNSLHHGFVRDTNGTFTTIDDPDGATTFVNGINNRGQIVGQFTASGVGHCFLLDPDGTFTTIDHPNATGTSCFGINNRGVILGLAAGPGNGNFLRAPDGTFTEIVPVPPPNGPGQGLGIGGHKVVGVFIIAGHGTHGFLFKRGVSTQIDDPNAGTFTEANGISRGGIVGAYLDTTGHFHGFLAKK